ncbi:hypothetical protein CrV_gp105 [Cylindrospermopsis raciborskii virus RM-2018a]|jgi:hypothetical protein|nr:hypothetical protein CrV_gp086 [Cylindrospermopsis raciborskii virus RM-2018a]AXK90515.1 hypothetical protein CrV_gp105 [Cylindrospermopsis raciborskii virus RM-2018a]WHL30657.1 hypothetical protein CrLKS4_g91 [Cylindrospermopsis phage Cr-LKS4]WHL30673.1 hypothetical protein CrLKS4_g107 [Cylindrospermopsis phage Cr-LKS4]
MMTQFEVTLRVNADEDVVLFDDFGIYAEVEPVYDNDHYNYYQDMYEVNGVSYY